jgi:hypothetical protein
MRPGNHLAKADANPYNLLANLVFLKIGRRLRKAMSLIFPQRIQGIRWHVRVRVRTIDESVSG